MYERDRKPTIDRLAGGPKVETVCSCRQEDACETHNDHLLVVLTFQPGIKETS